MTALGYNISLLWTTLQRTEFCISARACVRGEVGCILREVVAQRICTVFIFLAPLLSILLDIGLVDGQEIVVADATTPKPLIVKIHFSSDME